MNGETRFTGSYSGIGRMLKSPMIEAALLAKARTVMQAAVDTAPEDADAADPHEGRYRGSFRIRVGRTRNGSRVQVTVYNDSPEAIDVEKGTSAQPGRHVLIRALSAIGIL